MTSRLMTSLIKVKYLVQLLAAVFYPGTFLGGPYRPSFTVLLLFSTPDVIKERD